MPNRRQFALACAALTGPGLFAGDPKATLAYDPDPATKEPVLRVGSGRALKSIGHAARVAKDGSIVEVDAGDYFGDVAVWEHDNVTIRAVGGRVRLLANGNIAEGKGIWVVRAINMRVTGFDFEGAAAASRNGAGIRQEKGSLHVSDCRFVRNEMGLLTGNDPSTELSVQNCEFAYNQRPDGHNHNLYVGQIKRLTVSGSYFHHARTGHLLKSRAAENFVIGNRLTDENGGTASYELEFPNGGIAYVIGNLIEQNAQTENPHLVSFGAEGYQWARNEIYLVNNTLIDALPQEGIFLRVAPGAGVIAAINNLLLGLGSLDSAGPGDYRNNVRAQTSDFPMSGSHDFRLRADSHLAGRAVDPGAANGFSLRQTVEYVHPRATRTLSSAAHNPGAFQTAL